MAVDEYVYVCLEFLTSDLSQATFKLTTLLSVFHIQYKYCVISSYFSYVSSALASCKYSIWLEAFTLEILLWVFFFIFSNLVCVLCTLYVIAYTTIPRDKKPHIYELKPKDNPFAFWCYGNNKRTNSLEILAFMFCHYFVIVYRWKVASFSLYFAFFVFFMDCIARDTIWKKLKIFYLCKTSTNVNMICQSDGNRITLYTHIM